MLIILRTSYLVLVLLVWNCDVYAGVVLQPSELLPGEHYRLAFVTNGFRQATSSNIADYNGFVTSEADQSFALQGLKTTWKAIASTVTIAAPDNTGTTVSTLGVPIYRVDGVKIADNNFDFWDGSLLQPLSINQFGNINLAIAWTGCHSDGSSTFFESLGENIYYPLAGESTYTDSRWSSKTTAIYSNTPLSFYAVSGVLTVAVPEPSSLLLVCIAGGTWPFLRRPR